MFDQENLADLFLQIDHREPKATMTLEIMKEDAEEVIHKCCSDLMLITNLVANLDQSMIWDSTRSMFFHGIHRQSVERHRIISVKFQPSNQLVNITVKSPACFLYFSDLNSTRTETIDLTLDLDNDIDMSRFAPIFPKKAKKPELSAELNFIRKKFGKNYGINTVLNESTSDKHVSILRRKCSYYIVL